MDLFFSFQHEHFANVIVLRHQNWSFWYFSCDFNFNFTTECEENTFATSATLRCSSWGAQVLKPWIITRGEGELQSLRPPSHEALQSSEEPLHLGLLTFPVAVSLIYHSQCKGDIILQSSLTMRSSSDQSWRRLTCRKICLRKWILSSSFTSHNATIYWEPPPPPPISSFAILLAKWTEWHKMFIMEYCQKWNVTGLMLYMLERTIN